MNGWSDWKLSIVLAVWSEWTGATVKWVKFELCLHKSWAYSHSGFILNTHNQKFLQQEMPKLWENYPFELVKMQGFLFLYITKVCCGGSLHCVSAFIPLLAMAALHYGLNPARRSQSHSALVCPVFRVATPATWSASTWRKQGAIFVSHVVNTKCYIIASIFPSVRHEPVFRSSFRLYFVPFWK